MTASSVMKLTLAYMHTFRPAGRPDPKKTRLHQYASIACFIMLIVEIIGGIFSNSLALITDGARLFADHLSNYVINRDRAEGTWRRIGTF